MTDLSRIEFNRIDAAIVVAQYDGSVRCNKVSEFRTKMSAYGDCRINNNNRRSPGFVGAWPEKERVAPSKKPSAPGILRLRTVAFKAAI